MTNYGQTWWGNRWLNALSHIDYANRLPRGRSYARKGAVTGLDVSGRKIRAEVQGTRLKPYKVTVGIPAFSTGQKQTLTKAILKNPLLLSKLLNRELPSTLNDLAERQQIKIFPERWDDLQMHCSCPDWAVPCKHLAAVINVIAGEIDRNPFLIFRLHGYDIIGELRKKGLEAVSDTVSIPGLAELALNDSETSVAETSVADSGEPYTSGGVLSLNEIDFSVLQGMREKLLSLLTPQPVFFSKDFKKVLDNLYRRTARRIERANRYIASGSAGASENADGETGRFLPGHYAGYSAIRISCSATGDLRSCEITGDPGDHWKEMYEAGEDGTWNLYDPEELRMFVSGIGYSQVRRLSPGLIWLHFVFRFSRKLAETSSFIPQLVRVGGRAYTVRWIPAVIDREVRKIFNSLVAVLPPDVITPGLPAAEQVRSLVAMFLQLFVMDGGSDKSLMADPVYRIFFESSFTYSFERPGENEIPASIQRWIDRFYLARNRFAPVLEIFEKDGSGRFGLRVLVEDNHAPLQEAVLLSDVMTLPEFSSSKYEVLRSVEMLSSSLPGLEMIISTSGRHVPVYTPAEFARVMFMILPVIRLYGIRVLLPHELKNLVRPAVSVSLSASGSTPPKSLLNLEKILDFEWRVALGDRLMDAGEFFQMVKGLAGIVKLRDQYVYLDAADLKTLMEQIGRQERKMDRNRLLQAVFTGEYEGEKVEMDKTARKLIDELLSVREMALPEGLCATLRPYQQRGYEWLYKNASLGFGSIIADDMGLGKTLQVIVVLLQLKAEGFMDRGQALIVVPTTLLTNWQKEFDKFSPGISCAVFHGPGRQLDTVADVVLTSYGVSRSDHELLAGKKWRAVIIDEAQNIKNTNAAQTRAVKRLKADVRIAMTGTPVENRLSEYWSIFDFTNRGYLGNLKQFTREFAYPIEFNRDKKQLARFLKISSPFILRRLKTDRSIISDLPDKVENNYMASLEEQQAALYQGVLNTVMDGIEEIDPDEKEAGIRRRGMVLKLIMALKQVCNHPSQYLKKGDADPGLSGKSGLFLNLLENILDSNEKVLVFTQFREMGFLLQQMIREQFALEALFLHGGTSRRQRDQMVERFQKSTGEKIFILSIKAGGTGLNLTSASHVIHYDLWWNPAVESQATDRAYRIGQNRNVMVYRLITRGTFEEKINAMLKDKKELAELTVSNGEKWVGELSNRELKSLFSLSEDHPQAT